MHTEKKHYAWKILIACCLIMAGGNGIICCSPGVFFTPVSTDLDIPLAQLTAYVTVFSLTMAVALPIAAGILTKAKNIRGILAIVAIGSCVAWCCMGLYTSVWQWYLSGIILGICGSFLFLTLSPTLIGNWFKKKKGMAMGIAASMSPVCAIIMNPVIGGLISTVGWRTAYLITGLISLAMVLPPCLFIVRFRPEDVGMRPYGDEETDETETKEADSAEAAYLEGVPLKKARRSLPFILMFLAAGFAGFIGCYPQFVTGIGMESGFSITVASTLASACMAGSLICNLVMGPLNDKIGVKTTSTICMAGIVIGLLILIVGRGFFVTAMAGAFLLGFSLSFVNVFVPIILQTIFGDMSYAEILATVSTGMSLMSAPSPVLIGLIYGATGAYTMTLVVAAVIAVLLFIFVTVAVAAGKKLAWEKRLLHS